jgi:hypothetical protein
MNDRPAQWFFIMVIMVCVLQTEVWNLSVSAVIDFGRGLHCVWSLFDTNNSIQTCDTHDIFQRWLFGAQYLAVGLRLHRKMWML